uniref:Uncharacterized protein n=1 Tax=Lactuca sativa TaxID=4236 RepID=A0A9R1W3C1_LACSA|nr:hypothetical protein LSAT_V11C300101350 [Lactuca sativa]
MVKVDQERNAISEELVRKYNASVEDEEEVKKLDKSFKDLTREVQEVELDVKDREEKIIGSSKAKSATLLECLVHFIELFECDENLFTSIEVTYCWEHLIPCVIRHLNEEKGGRVTFIPLNHVKAPHVNYPKKKIM